ncbi:MAG: restriction endonuclease [Hydrogenophaga sp.]|nr:restriction endonuclease [Hydrogenophaga sp.]
MIDDPNPQEWRELQAGVCRLFNELGLKADTEVKLSTPRGEVEIDVLGVDVGSVDKIRYIVECKNWSSAIPQHVVHSFTTVMHETGANIGFIVSQKGLQAGAEKYTNNTNIVGMTYLELQARYFPVWWERFFCRQIGDLADELVDFVSGHSARCDELVAKLSPERAEHFESTRRCFGSFALLMTHLNIGRFTNLTEWPGRDSLLLRPPESLDQYKRDVLNRFWSHFEWQRVSTFRELMVMIKEILLEAQQMFREIFGGDIDDAWERETAKMP